MFEDDENAPMNVGDIITFGADPLQWRVTEVSGDGLAYRILPIRESYDKCRVAEMDNEPEVDEYDREFR